MLLSPIKPPFIEELRLKDLFDYKILDTPEEKEFTDLANLAAKVCNCPYAMITFIDKDRQWVKASKNLNEKEKKINIPFCSYTILHKEVIIVNNPGSDKRFLNTSNITEGLKINFYAGAPIISANGYALGTVCVIDDVGNKLFTAEQKDSLKIIADQVSTLVALRLKVKQIAAQSELIIAAEKKLAQLILISHELEKSNIANELHENFAQTLAGVKLNLEVVEQSKNVNPIILIKSKNYITDLIKDVKVLSKSIVPTTLENDNYLEIIYEMVTKFGKFNDIIIILSCKKTFCKFNANTGLTIFRILENQLKVAKKSGAKNIKIKIQQNKKICVSFIDDGNANIDFTEKDILLKNVLTRIEILNGTIIKRNNYKGENILELEIPLSVD